jgi:hypothetical protein
MIDRYPYLPQYNNNIYIQVLQLLYEKLDDVQQFLHAIGQDNAFHSIDELTNLYDNIFSPEILAAHTNFSIKKIYKSVYIIVPDPYSKGNSYFHLTLELKSEEIKWLNELYNSVLSNLLKFYKRLFSRIDNYYITLDRTQLGKYEVLLQEISENVGRFLEYVQHREIIAKRKQLDEKHLTRIPFGGLFYTTHIDNLKSILEHGILSHTIAHTRGYVKVDISNKTVNEKRNRVEASLGGNIHDFAPLYINPRNPMLFYLCKNSEKENLVLLKINPHILLADNVAFSNGNAAVRTTQFYRNIDDFNKLNWTVIGQEYWTNHPDGRRIRCSEVLVHEQIPVYYINEIIIYNDKPLDDILAWFPNHFGIKTFVNSDIYF